MIQGRSYLKLVGFLHQGSQLLPVNLLHISVYLYLPLSLALSLTLVLFSLLQQLFPPFTSAPFRVGGTRATFVSTGVLHYPYWFPYTL